MSREQEQHQVLEAGVNVVLTGDFTSSYYGDNSKVIPTDTIKNTVYVVAGRTKATCLEQFGLALAQHFLKGSLSSYPTTFLPTLPCYPTLTLAPVHCCPLSPVLASSPVCVWH